jgi:glycerophosphodiester phosphodiesterase
VKNSGLACITYGKENNDKSFARKQIEAGMDAVIVDSVLAIHNELTNGGL